MAAQPCWAVRGTKKGDLPVAAEKREVEAHGKRLSYYKWMAKAVLGGKMPKYDHMDEKKGAGGGGCCVVS